MERDIELLCREKESELLDKYFGNLVNEAAHVRPETIGEYTKDLPLKIEAEFKTYLKKLWKDFSDAPLKLEEQKLRTLLTDDDLERVEDAYKHAQRIGLWERITKTNHKDVTYYKGLLYEYTKELLAIMRIDFLEEITGKHINCKSFDD